MGDIRENVFYHWATWIMRQVCHCSIYIMNEFLGRHTLLLFQSTTYFNDGKRKALDDVR